MYIRATSAYQHYDQEYAFPEADALFGPPPWTLDLIPEAEPKQRRHRRRGRQSGLLVRLRRRAHHPPLRSILLINVQSLDKKVDEIRAQVAFQRDRDFNILCFTETWLTRDTLSESVQPPGFFMRSADRNKHLSCKKKGGCVCLIINDSWCNHINIQ